MVSPTTGIGAPSTSRMNFIDVTPVGGAAKTALNRVQVLARTVVDDRAVRVTWPVASLNEVSQPTFEWLTLHLIHADTW
jgi:hypothetical protein